MNIARAMQSLSNRTSPSANTFEDIFDDMAAWFNGDPLTDVNFSGGVSVQDIFDFLSGWFAGR